MFSNRRSSSCIDFERIVARNNGNFEAAFEELGRFIETLQEDMSRLHKFSQREDSLAIASVAYRLRGTAQELGVELLYRNALRVEQSARRNNTSQVASEIDLMQYQVDLISQSSRLSLAADLNVADKHRHAPHLEPVPATPPTPVTV